MGCNLPRMHHATVPYELYCDASLPHKHVTGCPLIRKYMNNAPSVQRKEMYFFMDRNCLACSWTVFHKKQRPYDYINI